MSFDRSALYEDSNDFYSLDGNNVMKLTPEAAIGVCCHCIEIDYIVSRIEGGIWHNPGFEMRLDCIWERNKKWNESPQLAKNEAIKFIEEELSEHNAFIVSLQKISK